MLLVAQQHLPGRLPDPYAVERLCDGLGGFLDRKQGPGKSEELVTEEQLSAAPVIPIALPKRQECSTHHNQIREVLLLTQRRDMAVVELPVVGVPGFGCENPEQRLRVYIVVIVILAVTQDVGKEEGGPFFSNARLA